MKRFKITIKNRPFYVLGKNRPVCVDIVIKNISRHDYYISTINTPLDSIPNSSLLLAKDGETLPYDGILVKRVTGGLSGLFLLKAGQRKKVRIDLSARYRLCQSGRYSLSLKNRSLSCYRTMENSSKGPQLDRCEVETLPVTKKSFWLIKPGEAVPTRGESLRRLEQSRLTDRMTDRRSDVLFPEPEIIFHEKSAIETETEFKKKVKNAHYEMIYYLERCLTELDGFTDKASNLHCRMAFGDYDETRYRTVTEVYRTVLNGLKNEKLTYERNKDDNEEDPDVYAYTTFGAKTVYLCPAFYKSRLTGEDSAAGCLLHEWTHAYRNTDDHEYGRKSCMELAKNNPDHAVDNADNFELFLETKFLNWNLASSQWPGCDNVKALKEGGPSAVSFNGKIYLFYCGNDDMLWKAEYSDGSFHAPEQLKAKDGQSIPSNFHPEAVVCDSRIYLFYLSTLKGNLCYLCMREDGVWLPETVAEDSSGKTFQPLYPPQPVIFKGRIHLIYKKDELSFCSTSLGMRDTYFSPESDVPDSGLMEEALHNPAPAVINGRLYILYCNRQDTAGHIRYAYYNEERNVWLMNHLLRNEADLPHMSTKNGIRSAADGDAVYLITRFPGQGQIQANYNSYLSRVVWTDGEELKYNTFNGTQPESTSLCSIVTFGEYNYLFGTDSQNRIIYAQQMRGR